MTTSAPPTVAGTTTDVPATVQDVAEAGVTGAHVPARYGGGGLPVPAAMRLLEDLGRRGTDPGVTFSAVTTMASTGVALTDFGTEEQRARYLPDLCAGRLVGAHAITEDEAGSDALGMTTRAVREGDAWRLDGRKTFVTNGGIADVYVVYARTSATPGPLGVTAFLVPAGTPGLRVVRLLPTMGLERAPVAELELDGCVVTDVVGRVGGGFLVLDHVMEREIVLSFAANLGEMDRRLDRCVARARERRQYGRPIGQFQAVAHRVADMKIAVETTRLWLYHAGDAIAAGRSATLEVSAAKIVASTANTRTALDAVQVFGGRGYLVEHGLEADVRHSVAGSIYSGTNEIQRNRIAGMLGLR